LTKWLGPSRSVHTVLPVLRSIMPPESEAMNHQPWWERKLLPPLRIPAKPFHQSWRQPRNSNGKLRRKATRAEDRVDLRLRLATRRRTHHRAARPRAVPLHRRRFLQESWFPANRDMSSAHSTRKEDTWM